MHQKKAPAFTASLGVTAREASILASADSIRFQNFYKSLDVFRNEVRFSYCPLWVEENVRRQVSNLSVLGAGSDDKKMATIVVACEGEGSREHCLKGISIKHGSEFESPVLGPNPSY